MIVSDKPVMISLSSLRSYVGLRPCAWTKQGDVEVRVIGVRHAHGWRRKITPMRTELTRSTTPIPGADFSRTYFRYGTDDRVFMHDWIGCAPCTEPGRRQVTTAGINAAWRAFDVGWISP